MTAAELRDTLASLRLTQDAGARLIGVDARTIRRWCDTRPDKPRRDDPPEPVARWLRYILAKGDSPEDVMRILAPFLSSEKASN